MRLNIVISSAFLLLLCATANAQLPTRPDTNGGPSTINPRSVPVNAPSAVGDLSLQHMGAVETWAAIAPRKNLAPSVTRIIGKDLHLALFNFQEKTGKLESSIAFQLRPFADKQMVKIQVFAVEQNGKPLTRAPLTDPQSIALKKQGAILPFTVEMQEGESLVCEIIFHINEQERGKARIRVSKTGLAFAPEEKPDDKKKP
ncbi:MAG: hypothetical protein AB1757_17285 [Acidobacteriota bacterium]